VLGNLLSVELPDGNLIEYVIDASNRRIGKKVGPPGATVLVRKWLYKDSLNPIYEEAWDATSSTWVQTRFVYASRGNVPDFLIRDGVTYRVISDHLGSPRLIIDTASGIVAQALEYDEWGNILSDTYVGTVPLHPFTFAGGLYDADTKLIRFGARDYDPEAGRWTAKDPIRFDGDGPNLYGYTSNDPINFIDQLGLFGETECDVYNDLCRAKPGVDSYYCILAPAVCRAAPDNQETGVDTLNKGSNISNCVRQCLQESAVNRELCEADGNSPQDNFQDHVSCFQGCIANPENPYNPNGPALPDGQNFIPGLYSFNLGQSN